MAIFFGPSCMTRSRRALYYHLDLCVAFPRAARAGCALACLAFCTVHPCPTFLRISMAEALDVSFVKQTLEATLHPQIANHYRAELLFLGSLTVVTALCYIATLIHEVCTNSKLWFFRFSQGQSVPASVGLFDGACRSSSIGAQCTSAMATSCRPLLHLR